MTKSKKIIIALACLSILLAVSPIIAVFSVDNGPQMYDISIKIACCSLTSDGRWVTVKNFELVFTPDTDEIHFEREYDGGECYYYVSGYSFPNHPYRRGKWYTPKHSGSDYFNYNLIDQTNHEENLTSIQKEGEYLLNVTTNTDANWWNDRTIRLYIKFKKVERL